MRQRRLGSEKGQALSELALFAVLAAIVGFGILSLIPLHRTRTAATAAAYGCAQMLAEAPNPKDAARQAHLIATRTLDGDWSATVGSQYDVDVNPPAGPGSPGSCTVRWSAPVMFNGLLGISDGGWGEVTFQSRSELWKAEW
jgi:hypothetical protein